MPESEITRYLTRFGALGRILRESDDETRTRVLAVVRPAFDPCVHGAEVRFTAACWLVGHPGLVPPQRAPAVSPGFLEGAAS